MIQYLSDETNKEQKFSICYLDKNEATFILCLLRPVSCSHCPDFYSGCNGSTTIQEMATLNEKEFIDRHIYGTEEFLCGKLRNIIALSRAEEQQMHNSFEQHFNKKVSLLTKKNDEEKYVLIQDKDEFNEILKSMEKQLTSKLQIDLDKINKYNIEIITGMQQKLSSQAKTIQTMQNVIKKLKKNRNLNE